ncbi:uncharacterized protein V1518DRAFT_415695 [Limtongia smithiae]|uniref:uncharacterized protein n=1 Tax=Limtongia smithiae TaxID=1125753 RepID=UPI0034CDAA18
MPSPQQPDAWSDDWTGSPATPGVLVVDSPDQLRSLFPPAAPPSNTTRPTIGHLPPSSALPPVPAPTSSQYRPQLRILKRAPDSASATASPPPSLSDARPGESEADRMDRVRRDKEAKYRAARENIFGPSATSVAPTPSTTIHRNTQRRPPPHTTASTPSSASLASTPADTYAPPTAPAVRMPRGPDGSTGFKYQKPHPPRQR